MKASKHTKITGDLSAFMGALPLPAYTLNLVGPHSRGLRTLPITSHRHGRRRRRHSCLRLFLPDLRKYIWVPPLPNIRVALDAVPERRLAQRARNAPAAERKLDIIEPPAPIGPQHVLAQPAHLAGHDADADALEVLERRVGLHALEERYREPAPLPRPRAQHPVRRRRAHPARQRLHPLPDRHHQRPGPRRAVDPLAPRVLRLQPPVPARLQQVAGQHRVLVGAHALPLAVVVAAAVQAQLARVRVPHDLELVLLVRAADVLVERARRQPHRLGHQAREADRHAAHQPHVLGVRAAKAREHALRRPLVGREEVVVPRRVWARHRVLGRQVDLLPVVYLACCYLC
ncbi:hypothetical protein N8I77_011985 [Diaporthe amygdali]|uniref:Uncharacterized protein n=1 Tax=Phomopsis amygdali TaxID=1214568 RepID=A0AAD9S4T4_PHOAM|nr:hypothetical protein N8I77_011985 [Diaporthe amygdali]